MRGPIKQQGASEVTQIRLLEPGLKEWRSGRARDSDGKKAQVGNENCDILEKCSVAQGARAIVNNEVRVRNTTVQVIT